MKAEIINLYNDGQRPIQIALNKNICIRDIYPILVKANLNSLINLTHSMPYLSKRDLAIVDMWNSKKYTYQSIADEVGITRERVRQILSKAKRKGYQVKDKHDVSKNRSQLHKESLIKKIDFNIRHSILAEYHNGKILDDIYKMYSNNITKNSFNVFCEYAKNTNLLNYKQHVFGYIKSSRDNPDAITEYRESVIMQMRKENKPLDDIAKKLDISKVRLTQIIRRMKNKGMYVPNSRVSGGTLSDAEIDKRVKLIEAYLDDGHSVQAISKILMMSPQHVAMLIYTHLVPK